jgi:hypothetical protein
MNGYQENPSLSSALVASLRTGKPRPVLSEWQRKKTTWIYGLFDSSGKCHYIGQTFNPERREKDHDWKYPALIMKTIRFCPTYSGARLETQIMTAYKKRGQASINIRKGHACRKRTDKIIYCATQGVYFTSLDEAAGHFGCCALTIRNRIESKDKDFQLSYV